MSRGAFIPLGYWPRYIADRVTIWTFDKTTSASSRKKATRARVLAGRAALQSDQQHAAAACATLPTKTLGSPRKAGGTRSACAARYPQESRNFYKD